MKEIYLLSGLGADKRVYDFLDLPGFNLNHIEWINPIKNESIENYAKRLLSQIPATKPTLVGVSFGGMMAIEIGKLIETNKIILISSAQTKFDIPFYYRLTGKIKLNRLIPSVLLKQVNAATYWFFGVKTSKEKELLKNIILETDSQFLKWAIDKIVNWENEALLKNVTTIHGTNDHILPIRNANHKINNGGHLMIINKAMEISNLIQVALQK